MRLNVLRRIMTHLPPPSLLVQLLYRNAGLIREQKPRRAYPKAYNGSNRDRSTHGWTHSSLVPMECFTAPSLVDLFLPDN